MSFPVAAGGRGYPPNDRDQLLAQVGERKAAIYAMVRTILDDLESVAPWDGLYYPPTDAAEFLGMETALVGMIKDIPERVETLTQAIQAGEMDPATRELVDNADFYFHGIEVSVASELEKLQAKLDAFKTGSISLSDVERTFTCEISADLKGKYTSSVMGAAASLIAEGLWNGIEIEPILFPEKAEEFDRNERLVARLSRVTETIHNFLDQVPMVDLVASWKQRRRVDQYALAPLYSLLGDLGKLMQLSSRRALYSGDYHQIQLREVLLSASINELTSLHSMTWRSGAGPDRTGDDVYAAMVEKALEMGASLDVDIIKKVIGERVVKDLFFIVTMEREDVSAGRADAEERRLARLSRVPEELHTLIPLLRDEDLKTFLDLLLGSVLKRASLTVKRQDPGPAAEMPGAAMPGAAMPAAAMPGAAMPGAQAPLDLEPPELLAPVTDDSLLADAMLSPLPAEFEFGDQAGPADLRDQLPQIEEAFLPEAFAPDDAWSPPDVSPSAGTLPLAGTLPQADMLPSADMLPRDDVAPAASIDQDADQLEALEKLLEVITPLLSRGSSNRKSFELVRRLLNQKRAIPASLLQSMRPYLYEVMNQLIPQLRDDVRLGDVFTDFGTRLFGHCQVLCDPNLSSESGVADVPAVMEQVVDLLNRLAIATRSSVERLSANSARP